jgi:hypothetical protein
MKACVTSNFFFGYIEEMVGVKSDRPNMQVIRQTLNVG